MDFIDFDSFGGNGASKDQNLPQPQPALSLPITSNIENLGKRISSFSLTRNLLKFDDSSNGENSHDNGNLMNETTVINKENEIAEKYAKLSMNLLKKDENTSHNNGITYNSDDERSAGVHNIKNSENQTRTTLSTRLSRVLNDSLSDSLIREIFTNLEDKFNDNDLAFEELIEPGFQGSVARKKLRGKIENELIKNQSLVLKEYQPIIRQLRIIEDRLNKVNTLNKITNEKINKNYKFSNEFNHQVNELNESKKLLSLKKNLLIAFKDQFTLNEYEEYVLTTGEINDEFFQTLRKAESINEKCSILLSIDNPQLGLKVMSKSNQIINKSLERIISFSNRTLNNLYSLSRSRLSTLHKCLRYLKNKLNYFSSIVNTFTEQRSKVLIDEFLNQVQGNLDNGSSISAPSGKSQRSSSISSDHSNSRPIFISAHDPIRFIGDLMAYVHSIVVNESETISSIFTLEVPESDEEVKEFKNIVDDIIDKILKALSRPIKTRIDQIIASQTRLSLLYSIYNLVELYALMFTKQLPNNSELLLTVKQLVYSSQDRFKTIISNRLATIKSSNSAKLDLNLDLQPPEWIVEFYSDILPIIDQMTTDTIFNLSKSDHQEFSTLIVNKPIEIFYEHIKENNLIEDKRDNIIIKLNFLDLTLSKIMPITLLNDKAIEVNEIINELVIELTQVQLDVLLNNCNLYDYYNIVQMICPITDDFFDVSIYEPIKENKLYNKEDIVKLNDIIQEFIPNALIDVQQSLMKLNSPMIVTDVITNSSLTFVKFYEKFNLINLEYLQQTFTWNSLELATLLGVEEEFFQQDRLDSLSPSV
ncbi:oligomeric complex COG6-domain-containing protein [Scheffersomyces amazonensis]|uniref:oligomeric complex COG6-domain-containing protein n=1 Tax=Scheffersomyces amazonensis TaxID=1078765 RepID=UPI00315DDF80